MKIRTKLFISFFSIALIILIFGVMMIQMLGIVNDQSTVIATNNLPSVFYTSNMNTITSDYRSAELQHIIASNAGEMTNQERKMEKLSAELEKMKVAYEPLLSTEEETEFYQSFLEEW